MNDTQKTEMHADYTWVTAVELAARHKVTPKTIRQMARQRRIPCIRYGKAWRFPLELVERVLLEAEGVGLEEVRP